jgi:hypothetical protein
MKKLINKYLLNFNGYWKAVHLIGFIILLVLLIIKGYSGLIEFTHPIDIHVELPTYEGTATSLSETDCVKVEHEHYPDIEVHEDEDGIWVEYKEEDE